MIPHFFEATPGRWKCSSCGKSRSDKIHQMTKLERVKAAIRTEYVTSKTLTRPDAHIIKEGRDFGLDPDHGVVVKGFDDPYGARWLRFRAACARNELRRTNDPRIRDYWSNRAMQADAEATAREKANAKVDC